VSNQPTLTQQTPDTEKHAKQFAASSKPSKVTSTFSLEKDHAEQDFWSPKVTESQSNQDTLPKDMHHSHMPEPHGTDPSTSRGSLNRGAAAAQQQLRVSHQGLYLLLGKMLRTRQLFSGDFQRYLPLTETTQAETSSGLSNHTHFLCMQRGLFTKKPSDHRTITTLTIF